MGRDLVSLSGFLLPESPRVISSLFGSVEASYRTRFQTSGFRPSLTQRPPASRSISAKHDRPKAISSRLGCSSLPIYVLTDCFVCEFSAVSINGFAPCSAIAQVLQCHAMTALACNRSRRIGHGVRSRVRCNEWARTQHSKRLPLDPGAIRQFGSRIGVNLFPMHRPPPPAFSLSVILMWYILDAMLSGGRTAIGPQWKGTELLTLIISECIPRTMLRPRSLNLLTA
jgi:hypothetical protein